MSRHPHAARRALPIAVTILLAVAAIVAVVLALPNGTTAANTSQQRTTGTTPPPHTSASTTGTSAAAAVAVPALPQLTAEESTTPTSPADITRHSTGTLAGTRNATTTAINAGQPGPDPDGYVTSESTAPTTSSASKPAAATTTTKPPAQPKPPATTAKQAPTTTKTSISTAKPPATTTKPAATTAKPAATNFGIPVTLGNATQLITVTAKTKSATVGTLRAWEKNANGTWRTVYGPVTANLGSAGIGPASEYYSRTPLGTFTLSQAFGRLANPGTALAYHVTGPNDWWVSDVNAPTYNTMQTCAKASCPFNTSLAEHLQSITPYYDYAVVMNVNRSPVVKGGGSAFFLHVTVGKPTEGCVAIDKSTLVQIMRWLKPAAHPRIATGVA